MPPTVSVIIPTFNCAKYLPDALDSVLAQTHAATQIIVIDDGSTDDTATRIQPYLARGITYIPQNNAGVSAARNHGLRLATGDLIAFLDSDDIWHPQKLQLQLAALQQLPEFALLGTAIFDWPNVSAPPLTESAAVSEIPWTDLAIRNYFTTSSVLLRTSTLKSLGPDPFDTTLQGPEDYDLWLRIAESAKVANLPLPLTGYRASLTGLGNQAQTMEAGMRRILQKLSQRGAWSRPGGSRLRNKAHSYFHLSCALMYGAAGHQKTAMSKALRSLLRYPFPFRKSEVKTRLVRLKIFAAATLRLLHLKSPPRHSVVQTANPSARLAVSPFYPENHHSPGSP